MKTSFPLKKTPSSSFSSPFTFSSPPALPSPPPPPPSLALECSLCQSSKRTLLGSSKGIGSNLPSEMSDLKISASSLRGKKGPFALPLPRNTRTTEGTAFTNRPAWRGWQKSHAVSQKFLQNNSSSLATSRPPPHLRSVGVLTYTAQ